MTDYSDFVAELYNKTDKDFAVFQRKIIKDDKLQILGVRTPELRKLAKKYKNFFNIISGFPDEYYEVVFIKLQIAAFLPFEEFIKISDYCTELISDWALCDCFAPGCISKNKSDYLPYIKKYLKSQKEFVCRFAFTTLLHFYIEEEWLEFIFESISSCRTDKYYTVMGAAWLLAEVLIKFYSAGFNYLNSTMCDIKIKNMAISKACDSFRMNKEQKEELKSLKSRGDEFGSRG